MTALKVLFIGGSGQISSACAQRAVDLGIDLHVLNRGRTSVRPLPAGARRLEGDIRDPASVRAAIGDREFDVVVTSWPSRPSTCSSTSIGSPGAPAS